MEELKDILVGLDQRISAYKSRLQDLQKKRSRLDEEIATIKKYLELAETLYRVEADKAKLASLSSQIITDDKGVRPFLLRTSRISPEKFFWDAVNMSE